MKNIYYSLNPFKKSLGLVMLAFMAFAQTSWSQCTITCPADITVNLGPGACDAVVNYNVDLSADCGLAAEATLDAGLASGETFPIGTTPVSFSFDDAGTILTCDFNVVVIENPTTGTQLNSSPATVSLDLDCEGVVGADLLLTGTDLGCFDDYIVELYFDMAKTQPVPGSPMVGNAQIGMTLIADITDPDSGNKAWNTVFVEDKVAPVLFCADITTACFETVPEVPVVLNADGNAALEIFTMDIPASIGPNAGTTTTADFVVDVPVGATVADLNLFIDLNHTFLDDLDVSLTSPSGTTLTVFAGLGCFGEFPINATFDQEGTAIGFCEDLDADGASVSGGFLGDLSVFDGEDISGTWTLTIVDDFNLDGGLLNAASLQLEAVLPAGVNMDACGAETLTFVDNVLVEGTCVNDVIERTWTLTDESGNAVSCVQTITITPATLEDVTAPSNFDGIDQPALACDGPWVKLANGHPSPVTTGSPGGGISCANLNSSYSDLRINVCATGASEGCFKVVRTWTVLDWCTGVIDTYVQQIKVEDDEGPSIAAIADLTISTDVWTCDATHYVEEPFIEDNCSDLISGYTVTASAGNVSFVAALGRYVITELPIGVHTYTVSAADCCGNETTETFNVTVEDLVPPTAVADLNHAVSLTVDGSGKVFAPTFDDGSNDACGSIFLKVIREEDLLNTQSGSAASQMTTTADLLNGDDDSGKGGNQIYFDDFVRFDCEDIGRTDIKVQLRVFDTDPGVGPITPNRMQLGGDLFGRYNDSWSNIIVEDKLAPFIVAPANITVSCQYWFDDAILEDVSNTTFGSIVTTDQNGDGVVNNLDRGTITGTDRVCPGDALYNAGNPTAEYQLDWGLNGLAGDNCSVESITISAVSSIVCGQGTISRIFTAVDPDGRTATALQTITIVDCDPFFINDTNCLNTDASDGVRWPCDFNSSTCGAGTAPAATGEPQIFGDDNCAIISVTFDDEEFPVVPDACFKIKRIWTVTDWCQYDQFDTDANDVFDPEDDGVIAGQWEYVQYIKVLSSVAPEFTCSADVTICDSTATTCVGSASLSQTVSDDCTPEDLLVVDFKIDLNNDGTYDYIGSNQAVYPYPNPNGLAILAAGYSDNGDGSYDITIGAIDYPLGTHSVLWNAEDKCSNAGSCSYLFTIEDCKLPTPKAKSGLAVEIMPATGMVTLPVAWFDNGSFDNCAIDELLVEFPASAAGTTTPSANAAPTVTFTCDHVATDQTVALWALDVNGNWDFVTTTVDVQDNQNSCGGGGTGSSAKISGAISTEMGEMVDEVTVKANADYTSMTDEFGEFLMNEVTTNESYLVSPTKTDGLRNGVSTLDLVHVSRHLIGLQTLDSPYKLIAADVNDDGVVNTFDLLDLQRVLLFVYDEFPNSNTSWRFVDAAYTFPNPANPFEYGFPENYSINNLDADMADLDFIGVKTGDVNNDATANATQSAQDRSFNGTYPMETKVSVDGEATTINFIAVEAAKLNGLQLNLDLGVYELAGLEAGALNVSDANITSARGQYFMSYAQGESVEVAAGDVLFTLTVNTANTTVAQELQLSNALATSEVYVDNGTIEVKNPTLVNGQQGLSHVLYQNRPNPFQQNTSIGFYLAQDANATITIYNVAGKLLKTINADYTQGQNNVEINSDELGANGVLIYQLSTDGFTTSKRMTVLK